MHTEIRDIFTFRQKNHSEGNVEKIGFCKNKKCLFQCKITLYGGSEDSCELFYNQHSHLSDCDLNTDIFKNLELVELCKTSEKPSNIIKRFNEKNKDKGKQIDDTEKNRKRISKLKCFEKKKTEETKVCDLRSLEEWFNEICVAKLNNEGIQGLSWDQAIISNFEIKGTDFAAFISTKNLQLNTIKQLSVDKITIAADGTYKLSKTGHPTLVLGVYDIQRKFHLSIN